MEKSDRPIYHVIDMRTGESKAAWKSAARAHKMVNELSPSGEMNHYLKKVEPGYVHSAKKEHEHYAEMTKRK